MRFRRFEIEGDSMLPTLVPGDFVIGVLSRNLAPGDVVALRHPNRNNFWLVKRIIATSGWIDLESGTLDGSPYDDAFRQEESETGRFFIDESSVFVLSDNRAATLADSRSWGAVPIDEVYRLGLRYWPIKTAGRLA